MNYLGLDDVLTIASAVLRVEPEVLMRTSRINTAESAVHAPGASFDGVEFHPGLERESHDVRFDVEVSAPTSRMAPARNQAARRRPEQRPRA